MSDMKAALVTEFTMRYAEVDPTRGSFGSSVGRGSRSLARTRPSLSSVHLLVERSTK